MKSYLKKLLGIFVCISVIIPVGFLLSACSHEHEFSTSYKNNSTHHWKICTTEDGCDIVDEYSPHDEYFSAWQTRTAATCTTDGLAYRVCKCGYEETKTLPATGHTISHEISYNTEYHWNNCIECDDPIAKTSHQIYNGICATCHYGAIARINDVYYTSFAEAIDSITDNTTPTTIVLFDDIAAQAVKVPSGKNIIFDLNGHTYTITQPAVGSTGTTTSGFQLLKGSNITFKNGVLTHATKYTEEADALDVQILIQNYCNLTLENVTLDARSKIANAEGTCLYALSNNYGNITLKGSTQIIADTERSAGYGGVAFDVWYSKSYSAGVNVTFDSTFTGYVNGKIEYGSNTAVENWESKACLTIEGGIFSAQEFTFVKNVTNANIVITGGTFNFDVSQYVAEGFRCVKLDNLYLVMAEVN